MPEINRDTHIAILDSLRAIAALSVCFYHFVTGPVDFVEDPFVLQFFSYGKYGVQFFFVISGFVIPLSMYKNSYGIVDFFTFLVKRFIRLEPPYIISILCFLLLIFARNHFSGFLHARFQGIDQLLFHLGYMVPFTNFDWLLDVYWTLAIEFQFYLFIALYYFLLKSDKRYIRILLYLILLLLSYFGEREFLFYWLPLFLLGNLLFLYKNKKIEEKELYITSILTLIHISVFISVPVFFASVLPFSVILYASSVQSKILSWIGKVSYSIYLFHTIVGTAIVNYLSHFCKNDIQRLIVVFIGVLFSIFFAFIMYKTVEQPSQRISSRIKYKGKIT